MARTTEEAVKDVIDTSLTNEEITPFLQAANRLVTDKLTGLGYSSEMLQEIETWLTAHFVAIRDPQILKEKIGENDVTYTGKSGFGLDATTYGQQVQLLDHKGVLASLSKQKGQDAEIKALL